MVEPVAALLQGRGHRAVRVRDAGLAQASDADVVAYSLNQGLVLVTFDRDLGRAAVRQGCQVLLFQPPERTARTRLGEHYAALIAELWSGAELVTVPRAGPPG